MTALSFCAAVVACAAGFVVIVMAVDFALSHREEPGVRRWHDERDALADATGWEVEG